MSPESTLMLNFAGVRKIPRVILMATLLTAFLAAACADDGRELAESQPWQTTTTRPPPPTSAPDSEVDESGLALTSPAFESGGELPDSATCLGDNNFPDLEWGTVDSQATEIAVSLSDQTDPDVPVLMWLLAGIPSSETGLAAGVIPEGAFETTDDYGITGYGQPCLDSYADGERDLQWKVYVLSEPSGLAAGHPGNKAWEAVQSNAIESASILSRRFNNL